MQKMPSIVKSAENQICAQCRSSIKQTPEYLRISIGGTREAFCSQHCEERYFRELGYARCIVEPRGLLDELKTLRTRYFDGVTVFRLYSIFISRYFTDLAAQNEFARSLQNS